MKKRIYPEKKRSNLSESQYEIIIDCLINSDSDSYQIAKIARCSVSQVTGILAAITRSNNFCGCCRP
jgi:hypothetical protein